jgi:hypothetical protein
VIVARVLVAILYSPLLVGLAVAYAGAWLLALFCRSLPGVLLTGEWVWPHKVLATMFDADGPLN